MVTRRNLTFFGLVLGATVFSWGAWLAANLGLATVVNVVPFEEVAIFRFLVAAVAGPPECLNWWMVRSLTVLELLIHGTTYAALAPWASWFDHDLSTAA